VAWDHLGDALPVKPRWASKMQKLSTIGSHVFYRED
jgi:spore germination cell wall hydrolase CwlJ-like protein